MFADNLKRLRKNTGLTQQQVADAIKVDRSTYSYYEIGKTTPDLKNMSKLIRIFNTTYEELIEGKAVKKAPNRLSDVNAFSNGPMGLKKSAQLSKDEKLLVSFYRLLTDDDKSKLIHDASTKATKFCLEDLTQK